jgi:protein involved in polysaccharide export with SLBB domain
MLFNLYRKRSKTLKNIAFRLLFSLLIFQLIFPAGVLAQSQRRGVFFQDEATTNRPDSFREQEPGPDQEYDSTSGQYLPGSSQRTTQESAYADRVSLIYQVHVLGEVKRPGTYRVSPSMRVTDALQLAGNVKTIGSERFIELRKPGQHKSQNLDLFAYKTLGQLSQNPYLQDNDTIFVPLKMRAVEIEGPVRRPGIFELKNEKSLEDIVRLAGGFTVGLDPTQPVKIVRYGGNETKQILDVTSTPTYMESFFVQDGDVIVVPHKFLSGHEFDYNLKKLPNDNIFFPAYEDRVFVIGAVRVPGAFDFNQNYTLRQYLTLAGGTTTMAKNKKIKVITVAGQNYQAKDGDYDRVINPGDTIVVPEKSIPSSFYIGLLPTIASLGLSAAALFK